MAILGNINLLKYVGAKKVNVGGENGIFIPVESNPTIFVSDAGAFAGIKVVPHESDYEGKHFTHFFAASISNKKFSDNFRTMHGDEAFRKATPILGNAAEWGQGQRPQSSGYEAVNDMSDDLPY